MTDPICTKDQMYVESDVRPPMEILILLRINKRQTTISPEDNLWGILIKPPFTILFNHILLNEVVNLFYLSGKLPLHRQTTEQFRIRQFFFVIAKSTFFFH